MINLKSSVSTNIILLTKNCINIKESITSIYRKYFFLIKNTLPFSTKNSIDKKINIPIVNPVLMEEPLSINVKKLAKTNNDKNEIAKIYIFILLFNIFNLIKYTRCIN